MGKKLTVKEREERSIQRVFNRIKGLEKSYPLRHIQLGARRYAEKKREQSRLTQEIREKEKELEKLKTRKR